MRHAPTPADQAAEAHRHAYNAAFDELGLNWHWDAATYAGVHAQGATGLRSYLEREHAHLLRAYEADFLISAIEAAKARCHAAMNAERPRASCYVARPAHLLARVVA